MKDGLRYKEGEFRHPKVPGSGPALSPYEPTLSMALSLNLPSPGKPLPPALDGSY